MEEEIKYYTCSTCDEKKPLTTEYFHKRKDSKTGFRHQCKICKKANRSSEPVKRYNKSKKASDCRKRYRKNNHKLLIERDFIRRQNMTPKQKKIRLEQKKLWTKKQMETNELFIVSIGIRTLLRSSFKSKGWSKDSKTQDYLGCDWETFKEHIESQFVDGMSWNNQGEWHYDHYYPKSLAKTHEDMYIFNHYTNFQPLWAKDNLSKSNKVPDGFEGWYDMMKTKLDKNSKD